METAKVRTKVAGTADAAPPKIGALTHPMTNFPAWTFAIHFAGAKAGLL
jgi:hypothetical protein